MNTEELKNKQKEAFQGNNKDSFRDIKAKAVDAIDLMTALQGEIYKRITGGGEAGAASEDNFFCWATPGIPVTKEDFEFAAQGFRPKRFDKASIINAEFKDGPLKEVLDTARELALAKAKENEGSGETEDEITQNIVNLLVSDKDIKAMKADAAWSRYMQAEQFAYMVDFIPDISGWQKEGGSKLQVLEDEGKISDVYKYALRYSQVRKDELSEEDKKTLEENRAIMFKTVVQESDVKNVPPIEITEQTSVAKAYYAKMSAYHAKATELADMQIAATTSNDPEDIHTFARKAKLLKEQVHAAQLEWEGAGYKSLYEKAAATVSHLEGQSAVLMREEYKEALKNAYVSGLCSGQEFPYTTLSPADFADTNNWTLIKFSSDQCNTSSARAGKASGGHFNAKAKCFTYKAEGHYDHEEGENVRLDTFDFTKFSLEFEICQVDIVRPWFKPSFLNNRYWRFKPGNLKDENGNEVVEMLSNGPDNPIGMMPAYPTSIIFMRNLKLVFEDGDDAKDFLSKYNNTDWGVSAGVDYIIGSASAGYNHHDNSAEGEDARRLSRSSKTITVDGMQIIGFRCHILGKCPDPLPSITEWI